MDIHQIDSTQPGRNMAALTSVGFATPKEALYWTKAFECTESEARNAVRVVGPSVRAVRLYLKNKSVLARRAEQNRLF